MKTNEERRLEVAAAVTLWCRDLASGDYDPMDMIDEAKKFAPLVVDLVKQKVFPEPKGWDAPVKKAAPKAKKPAARKAPAKKAKKK